MTFLQPSAVPVAPAEAPTVKLDLLGLLQSAAWPVRITVALLVLCSLLVWIIAALKLMQLSRLRSIEGDFERRARRAGTAGELERGGQKNQAGDSLRLCGAQLLLGQRPRVRDCGRQALEAFNQVDEFAHLIQA